MAKTISAAAFAKVTQSRVGNLTKRERLFRTLDQERSRPCIWISAPAGAGKTSLTASYIESRKLTALWYQVDARDTDPAAFFYYMGLAGKKAAPRRKPLPLLTPEYRLGLPTFTRRFFEEIFDRLRPPAVIVFDNVHEAPSPEVRAILNDAMAVAPEGFTGILISREGPPPELSRLRANGHMAVLDWQRLRFTPEESYRVAEARGFLGDSGFSREDVNRLHEKVQGWVTGLLLLLERACSEAFPSASLNAEDHKRIFDYLASELFERAPTELQRFLVTISLLPQVTPSLIHRLTGDPHAGERLLELKQRNYFITCQSQAHPVCQFHALFRDFLRVQASRILAPDVLRRLRQEAAVLLLAEDQGDAAVDLLREAGAWDVLRASIYEQAPGLLAQGRYSTLDRWLAELPVEITEEDPWLRYWQGMVRLPFEPDRARRFFEQAYELFKTRDERPGMYLAWAGIMDGISYAWNEMAPAGPWLAEFAENFGERPDFPSTDIAARVIHSMAFTLIYHAPWHPDLGYWIGLLEKVVDSITDEGQRLQAALPLLTYHHWLGHWNEYGLLLNKLSPHLGGKDSAPPMTLITWYLKVASRGWVVGAADQSLDAIEKGLGLAADTGIHVLDGLLLAHGVAASLNQGEMARAARYLDRMEAQLVQSPLQYHSVFHISKVWQALCLGNLGKVKEHAVAARDFTERLGMPFPRAWFHYVLSVVEWELGNRDEAERLLEPVKALARDMGSRYLDAFYWTARARYSLERGEPEAADEWLGRLFAYYREEVLSGQYLWQPEVMARLCVRALEAGIEVDYVRALIRRRRLISTQPPQHLANWLWPVRIYTLGRFALERDDEPVIPAGKVQKRPLEMLKVLIAMGGSEVGQERIAAAVWPEAEGDAAIRSFKISLHRLRKLLGDQQVLQLHDGRLTLDPRRCWVDSWALGRLLRQAKSALAHSQPERAWHLTDRIMALYQGGFLGDEGLQPWAVSYRDYLRRRLTWHLDSVAAALRDADFYEEEIGCYRYGLEVDNLAEQNYRGMMDCYRRHGRYCEALAVYQRCRQTLGSVLGIEPSAETRALMQVLTAESSQMTVP